LRLAVWFTFLLVLVGAAGLGIHRWHPIWLKQWHLERAAASPADSAGHPAHSASSTHTSTQTSPARRTPAPIVVVSPSGPDSANVTVASATYNVVVSAIQPVWIQASSPASFDPLFSDILQPGQSQSFPSSNGQLSIEMGAVGGTVTVTIRGKAVPNWQFQPSDAPFTLNFASKGTGGGT
jgi:hypothetical protein